MLELIRELGLELQVIFNKGAVMVLPTGVNKATGLKGALKELKVLPEKVVAVGDAENDHAFLDYCGFSAAVANALPAVQEHAGYGYHCGPRRRSNGTHTGSNRRDVNIQRQVTSRGRLTPPDTAPA